METPTIETTAGVIVTKHTDLTPGAPNLVEQIALHYSGGGSDKIWAMALFDNLDGTATLKSLWGRRGANPQSGEKPRIPYATALKEFTKKKTEKLTEGYKAIPFNNPTYGVPSFVPLTGQAGADADASEQPVPVPAAGSADLASPAITSPAPAYVTAHLTACSWADVQAALLDERFGLSEKENGERCVVAYSGVAGSEVTAYNRRGKLATTVPAAALHLAKLGKQFVIDGERLTGARAGEYVCFDLLELAGQNVRELPYWQRFNLLHQNMLAAGLLREAKPTYSSSASQATLVAGLTLLSAATYEATKKLTLLAVQARAGEGVIIRDLQAPYQEGDTRYIRKFKFLTEIDVVVIGVKPGIATGSITMGLYRTNPDGTQDIIEVGNVRSGLNDAGVFRLGEMLERGEQPVLRVEFLPARTVGIMLVEPRTSIEKLRTDKLATECSTDQLLEFGDPTEKAKLIAATAASAKGRSS